MRVLFRLALFPFPRSSASPRVTSLRQVLLDCCLRRSTRPRRLFQVSNIPVALVLSTAPTAPWPMASPTPPRTSGLTLVKARLRSVKSPTLPLALRVSLSPRTPSNTRPRPVSRVGLIFEHHICLCADWRCACISAARGGGQLVQRAVPPGPYQQIHLRKRLHRAWWSCRLVACCRGHRRRLLR